MTDIDALRAGDNRALARAITLLESTRAEDRRAAERVLQQAMPHTGGAIRVGVTGAPGVGKSTFIEAFGRHALADGRRMAVLTVDPSSSISGGSILGDKTRMETLAADARAFIRPSPAAQTLGGIARRTQEAMLLCEAAGFDLVLIETVGVGQSETMVAALTDIFVLILSPAAGDELQGMKRGIMESADIIVINKSDGDLAPRAAVTAAEVAGALALMKPRAPKWRAPVLRVSAAEKIGLEKVWQKIDAYYNLLKANGALQKKRGEQTRDWLWFEAGEQLLAELKKNSAVGDMMNRVAQQVGAGRTPAAAAARKLVATFMGAAK